jgi:hypothetical protein
LYNAKVRAFKEFYMRPGYVFNTIKRIRSPANIARAFYQSTSFVKSWVLDSKKKD